MNKVIRFKMRSEMNELVDTLDDNYKGVKFDEERIDLDFLHTENKCIKHI